MITGPIIVKVLESVVEAMRVSSISTDTESMINYEPGRALQITRSLLEKDGSTSNKGKKYPLIAPIMPIEEVIVKGSYIKVKISRLTIATITKSDERVLDKYNSTGTFIYTLYPCYREFLNQLALNGIILGSDPNGFNHIKRDNPAVYPISDTSDYIDSIDILNLELLLNYIKTC